MKGTKTILLIFIVSVIITLVSVYLIFRYVIYPQAASKSRDAKRKADLNALQLSLEMYFANENHYPLASGDKVFVTHSSTDLNQVLVGPYLLASIEDPLSPDWPQYFYWQIDKNTYTLYAKLEDKTIKDDFKLQIGTQELTYNYRVTNKTDTTPTPTQNRPKVTLTVTPTPTSPPAAKPTDWIPPGKKKK